MRKLTLNGTLISGLGTLPSYQESIVVDFLPTNLFTNRQWDSSTQIASVSPFESIVSVLMFGLISVHRALKKYENNATSSSRNSSARWTLSQAKHQNDQWLTWTYWFALCRRIPLSLVLEALQTNETYMTGTTLMLAICPVQIVFSVVPIVGLEWQGSTGLRIPLQGTYK